MNELSIRQWAQKYENLLNGRLTQYLLGNQDLGVALMGVVEDLVDSRDLDKLRDLLEDRLRSIHNEEPKLRREEEFLEWVLSKLESQEYTSTKKSIPYSSVRSQSCN